MTQAVCRAALFHPVRAFFLERGLYALLAFDVWALMIQHGGRYGVGGFNVAHFAWLERLVPNPTPALYVGLLSASGLLAFCGALGTLPPVGRAVLFGLYSFAWAISLHDSYQHHYLLSWLLLFLASFPTLSVRMCAWTKHVISSLGMSLVATCCAVVYTFTAVSKLSPAWRSGYVLRALSRSNGPLALVPRGLMSVGIAEDSAFRAAALGIVLLQACVALGFLASTLRDTARGRGLGVLCSVALTLSLSFHLLTELDSAFAIGWFSYYMAWIAVVLLVPWRWLQVLLYAPARLSRWLRFETAPPRALVRQTGTLALGLAVLTAIEADLPGVLEASLGVYFGGLLWTSQGVARRRTRLGFRAWSSLCASFVAFLTLLGSGQVRFDYYRRLAGELSRMGQLSQSLEFYRRAERYAPDGQSRRERIRELERQRSEQGGQ